MKEKKDRVDDALHATRAAVAEGIIPGGGVALVRTIAVLDKVETANHDEKMGVDIIRIALEAPLRQIVENAGTEVYEDLIKAGVIDPTKVTRVALENAASIASMILTTEAAITDEPEEKSAGGGMPGGMPGGMGGMM